MYDYYKGPDVILSHTKPASGPFIEVVTEPEYPRNGGTYISAIEDGELVWAKVGAPCHTHNYQGRRTQKVAYLVFHYVGALGAARDNTYYYGTTPGIGASVHYFVGHAEDGADVWSSVPEDCVASHCGRTDGKYKHPTCRNANSIGIELCYHRRDDGTWYFDPETIAGAWSWAGTLWPGTAPTRIMCSGTMM